MTIPIPSQIRILFRRMFLPEYVQLEKWKILIDKNDSLGLSKGNSYEILIQDLLKRTIKKGDVVVDVGANIGVHTLLMAELVGPEGKVYAFEPDKTNFELLKNNMKINGYENVKCYNLAVSDKNDLIKLYLCKDNLATHRIYKSNVSGKFSGKYDMIECVTLDSIIKEKIDFIKIDVEGAEPAVINGARRILSNPNIQMITEFYPLLISKFGYNYKQHLKDLNYMGFKLYDTNIFDERGYRHLLDFDEYTPEKINYTNLYCKR